MTKDFNTLEDFDFRDKTVLLRVDINCPLDKTTLKIVNDARIRRVVPTIGSSSGRGPRSSSSRTRAARAAGTSSRWSSTPTTCPSTWACP